MNGKTALELLEYLIEQYYRINGTPTLDDIKGQINSLKDYEREQLHIANVSNMLCGSFDPDTTTSSATKCKCGREKWEHPKAT